MPERALAIETSGRLGSLALIEDSVIVGTEQFSHGLQHAARIIAVLDEHCQRLRWTPRDLQTIFVSTGPGSFTGLRIGITVAKTLAFATGAKIVAVPTLKVLANNAPPEATHVIIVLDAKRGQIFTGRFERRGDDWHEIEPPHLDTLANMVARSPRPVHLIGDGIPYHPFVGEGVISTSSEIWPARAEVVARLGASIALSGQYVDPYQLAPVYIRLAEAEEKWQAAHGPT